MKRRIIPWSPAELAWVKANSTRPRAEAHAEFCRIFVRADVSLKNFVALCKRRGWMTGRTGRYVPGQESPTKGTRCAPGTGGQHPNARKHHFRQGERRGVAIRLYKPIGTERLSKDGYIERKTNDGKSLRRRWRAVHLIRWEAEHGPVPRGHCLKCLDGDKRNTDPDNWCAIPRALLPRLAGRWHLSYDDAPPELRPILMKIARLEHAARERRRSRQA